MTKALIAVCTCLRPDLLRKCLQSLCEMEVPAGWQCLVAVIDNDNAGSAKPVFEEFAGVSTLEFLYHCENQRGIPFARNAAIDIARQHAVEALIFIDDDEWVEKTWLQQLTSYSAAHDHKAIISGFVVEHLPQQTPTHIKNQFGRKKRSTGTRLYTCATNNVLIPLALIHSMDLRFDQSNPLAGGTDTLFFQAASEQGALIYRCDEAVVHESIPASRATLNWLSKRKYRVGITDALKKINQGKHRLSIVFRAALMTAIELIKSVIFLVLLSPTKATKFWLRACKQAGIIAGIMGATFDSYKVIDT